MKHEFNVTKHEFSVGDIVWLRSGGTTMTITNVYHSKVDLAWATPYAAGIIANIPVSAITHKELSK